MKKILLLFLMALTFTATLSAQSTLPRPHNPSADDWIDWGEGGAEFDFTIQTELLNQENPVDENWTMDKEITGAGGYTVLDASKVTYSIFTDYDQIFTFMPEDFLDPVTNQPVDITEPTTEIPFHFVGSNQWFEYFVVHFSSKFSNIIEGQEPFFKYRIGIRVNYTDNGQTSHSDIVYLYPFPEYPEIPALRGDVNLDGNVDVTDVNILVNIILGKDSADNYDGRACITDGDTDVDVNDVNALLGLVLGN